MGSGSLSRALSHPRHAKSKKWSPKKQLYQQRLKNSIDIYRPSHRYLSSVIYGHLTSLGKALRTVRCGRFRSKPERGDLDGSDPKSGFEGPSTVNGAFGKQQPDAIGNRRPPLLTALSADVK